ncbi:hypothetical protein ACFZB9_02840 [Kitasatospora sp. NPDC008050]|uniref:hypothetical protein n=1 Tax=Kitasatospora sp. NPDC008050 TaxID=3364021 RepID=UPI0036E9D0E2
MREPVQVEPDALVAYGQLIDQQYSELSQIQATLAQVQIPDGAFGKLPDSAGLLDAYTGHADAEQQNCSDLMDCLDYATSGLQTTAGNYAGTDADMAGMFGGAQ